MDGVYRKWNLPYSNVGIPRDLHIKNVWVKALTESFTQEHKFHPTLRLTESKIRQLVDDYWKANPDNRHKSLQDLRKKVLYWVRKKTYMSTSQLLVHTHGLLEILQRHLHLEVEGMSDSLHHSKLFSTWISAYKSDKSFGALFDIFTQSLSGKTHILIPHLITYLQMKMQYLELSEK